jgi:hypothetical protein
LATLSRPRRSRSSKKGFGGLFLTRRTRRPDGKRRADEVIE